MIEGCRHEEISEEGFCRDCGSRAAIKLPIKIGDAMSEGVKYRALELITGLPKTVSLEETTAARKEWHAAERTALDYARIDALRLAAEKEVDVLAGELEAAKERIEFLEARLHPQDVATVDYCIRSKHERLAAQERIEELEVARKRIAELEAILQKTLLALNTCRIIMDSKEARDIAGDIVKRGRRALDRGQS